MKATDAIIQRFSPLSFTGEIPCEDILVQLFEAARWAP